MHQYTCLAMTCSALLLVLASSSSASTIPVIVCPPGLKEVPASIRHLCVALLAERDTPPEEGKRMQPVTHVV